MNDVAIIGVGLHPFGRFGEKTAFDMGAEAIDLALADAGIGWSDVGFAFGGEPIGASGLRQVHELVLQLRGRAGDLRVGYAQVYGAPGTAAVTILSR